LENLPIEVDNAALDQVWTATYLLAQKHRLSGYDAAYLEMAIRRAVSLGSLDRGLRAAAHAESVSLLPL
jgi:predicted nucleic acid-binding protein